MELILSSAAIFVGCFFATVSGFGFALISTPLLSMVLSPKEAIILIPLLTVLLRIITMYQCRRDFDWQILLYISLGWIVGVLPGSYVLRAISMTHLQIFLGIVLLGATWLMGRKYYLTVENKIIGRLGAGVLAGFFGTSTSVSGPPVAIYLLNEKLDKRIVRGNMVWIFGVGNFLTTVTNFLSGNAKAVIDYQQVLLAVPAVFVAAFLGNKAFKYVDQELFRKISLCIICLGGVMLLINGFRGV